MVFFDCCRENRFVIRIWAVDIVKKASLVGVGLAICVLVAGCERGTKRIEPGDNVVKQVQSEVQGSDVEEFAADALITRVEALRDREFRRRPVLVAESISRLALEAQDDVGAENDDGRAVRDDRAAIFAGLMGRQAADKAGLHDGLAALARYDAAAGKVTYANGYKDRETLRLAIVLALVQGLNAEYFESFSAPKTWDESLALDASVLGDAMFVVAQIALADEGKTVDAREVARFPEVALRNQALRGLLDGVLAADEGVASKITQAEHGFSAREGYALATALYRVNGWSAVEMMKHAPPRSSGYVVRPDRWFSGDDLGTWSWPAELEAGWDEKTWHSNVQSGRVGPAVIAMWLGQTIDPAAARTIYAGWRSDEYRLHHGKRIASARRKGAKVFEWVSQWDTPHSAAQVADAFRLVLERGQSEREDGARHVVVQSGLNVAVIVTDSDAEFFRETSKLVDRAAVLSGAQVRYGQVQGLPFSFQPTRLEQFLVGAASATMADDRFEDPASGVRMDLGVLKKSWSVQKTDESSIRWFARLKDQDNGALIQFTTELRDVLGPEFGTEAYREKIQSAFARSLGVEKVDVRILEQAAGVFKAGSVLEIRGDGAVDGKPRALWLRQFLVGDVLCTLSLQDSPKHLDANLEVVQAVFEGISVDPVVESAKNDGDETIRILVDD